MTAVGRCYSLAFRYARACPWLFLVPAGFEVVQHVAEWRAGFYSGVAAMKAAEHDPLRMAFGHLKVIALFLTGWWAVRFYASGDAGFAARWDARAGALFAPVMAFDLLGLVLGQDVPWAATAAGWPARPVALVTVAVVLAIGLFGPCLSAWRSAAVLGDARVGFVRSVRLTGGSYWWALGVSLGAVLPPMVAHYALAVVALGRGPTALALVLALDSVLVAYLGAVIMAATWVVARRVAGRAGIEFRISNSRVVELTPMGI